MDERRSDYDVTDTVRTTDAQSVGSEVQRIFRELYQSEASSVLAQSFQDAARLFRGEYPGHHPCDTDYHDLQHTLDVTLAMSRLMAGFEQARRGATRLNPRLFELGVITALFHDCGYIRRENESTVATGAAFTKVHVSRGGEFLQHYLHAIGRDADRALAVQLIHFTGYEMPVNEIAVSEPAHRLLGNLLGSADIIAQMSDRCYLEKVRDRLYDEFVAGGIARQRRPDGGEQVLFGSPEDLVFKTPAFYATALKRLQEMLGGVHAYAEAHFGGQNLYAEEVERNVQYAKQVAQQGDASLLRRHPPAPVHRAPDANAGDPKPGLAAPKVSALASCSDNT
ncbi:MAG: HD domain-containing protein [Pseudomonadota bacterium]